MEASQFAPVENQATATAFTWNGALSHITTKSALVDLFFKSVRNINCVDYCAVPSKTKSTSNDQSYNDRSSKSFETLLNEAWAEDQLRTLKFIFHLRDCRQGKGEKKLFRAAVRHFRSKNMSGYITLNMEHIPFYGTWKDVSMCFFGTELEDKAIKLFANQLKDDINSTSPSLCAKFAPSEGGALDKRYKAVKKLCAELKVSKSEYRKAYLVPLREKLNIVERDMCSKSWAEIDYQKVPSKAASIYKSAFRKHDEERYQEYLLKVQKGEKKMNTSVLMPYEIVGHYVDGGYIDETVEAQWKSFVKDRTSKWPKGINVLPIIDVSGSMVGMPMKVAISLGMLFSMLNSSDQYKGKFITFDTHPQMLKFNLDETLQEQVAYVKSAPWGGSTNFQASLDLILDTATLFNVPEEQMPQILFVFSDMQFNHADGNAKRTNWNLIEEKYKKAGYTRPTIVFWNLNGSTSDYPVPDKSVPDCALVSGFNDSFMYTILEGKIPSPLDVVLSVLDGERYQRIRLTE